ncbi:MAG: glycosyltransferase [Roseinatronobacter sp.]
MGEPQESVAGLGNPRNPWERRAAVLSAINEGDWGRAAACLSHLRDYPGVPEGLYQIWQSQLLTQARAQDAVIPLDHPAQYLSNPEGQYRPPLRKLHVDQEVPYRFPFGMGLPGFVGQANDTRFLDQAAVLQGARSQSATMQIHVIWTPDPASPRSTRIEALTTLIADLGAQERACVALLQVQDPDLDAHAPFPIQFQALSECPKSGLVVFLSGKVRLDPLALVRASWATRISERVVHPFVPCPEAEARLNTLYTPERPGGPFTGRYPFRDVIGLNLALSARLLRRTGLPEPRLRDLSLAGRELAYRAWSLGAWFLPVRVPGLELQNTSPTVMERNLFASLCPNTWDRKQDGAFEVPKVSIYIPCYNAAKYIERAIDSVLAQDVTDLDICIANDGSTDATLAVLDARYKTEPRVRWIDNPNGGIGFASNTAIRMSRSLYIGQLDSDDCLKPGAVRRLTEVLDSSPSIICAYGSCERIDAHDQNAGTEYSWPVFSREKMMLTSIVHHFRMFRRAAWERTPGFREDIVNGVDYDLFLKLAELGEMRHIDEVLYQRRWHGENTSHVNVDRQTSNTHRAQRAALERQGLSRFWDIAVPDPEKPRQVSYRRRDGVPYVVMWPDYTRGNPYQTLLYAKAHRKAEIVSGDIDAAHRAMTSGGVRPTDMIFHLHWLNAVFRSATTDAEARALAERFIDKVRYSQALGAKLVWTVHNHLTHDAPFPETERWLSEQLAQLADVVHLHCKRSLEEVTEAFDLPSENVFVAPHGHYIGAYPDILTRTAARVELGLGTDEDVILFTGLIRPYKGVEDLIAAFRKQLADRPRARLILAGEPRFDPLADVDLSDAERARILSTGRFVSDAELQVFFRAADVAVYPYRKILTSGSLMLALSFGAPVIVPRVAMTAEVLEGQEAGYLYADGIAGLDKALSQALQDKDTGALAAKAARAQSVARRQDWADLGEMFTTLIAARPRRAVA